MQPWKKLGERVLYSHYRTLLEKKFLLPNGKTEIYETIKAKDIVSILAITENNKVILARQFRPGTEEIYDELPGGFVEDGASPEQTAKKELLEETGYQGDLKFVGISAESAYSGTINHCFVSTNCKKVSKQSLDDSEFVDVIELSLPDFRKHLREGNCTTKIAGYLGLEFLEEYVHERDKQR